MRRLRSAILAAAILGSSAAWAATEEEDFVGAYKKFGVGTSASTSRRPCLCVGGEFNGKAGVLVLYPNNLAEFSTYAYECVTRGFVSGILSAESFCVLGGGSVVLLSK